MIKLPLLVKITTFSLDGCYSSLSAPGTSYQAAIKSNSIVYFIKEIKDPYDNWMWIKILYQNKIWFYIGYNPTFYTFEEFISNFEILK